MTYLIVRKMRYDSRFYKFFYHTIHQLHITFQINQDKNAFPEIILNQFKKIKYTLILVFLYHFLLLFLYFVFKKIGHKFSRLRNRKTRIMG